jgi:hypothetical protein
MYVLQNLKGLWMGARNSESKKGSKIELLYYVSNTMNDNIYSF